MQNKIYIWDNREEYSGHAYTFVTSALPQDEMIAAGAALGGLMVLAATEFTLLDQTFTSVQADYNFLHCGAFFTWAKEDEVTPYVLEQRGETIYFTPGNMWTILSKDTLAYLRRSWALNEDRYSFIDFFDTEFKKRFAAEPTPGAV